MQLGTNNKNQNWAPRCDKVKVFTDGASRYNPGDAAIAYRILNEDGVVLKEHKEAIGIKTNNEAEYLALIAALGEASGHTRGTVVCHTDSQLIAAQMNGSWRIKKQQLKKLHLAAKQLESAFNEVIYVHVSREHEQIVVCDRLANEALDGK